MPNGNGVKTLDIAVKLGTVLLVGFIAWAFYGRLDRMENETKGIRESYASELKEVRNTYATDKMVVGITKNLEHRIDALESAPKAIERLCTQIDSLNKDIARLRQLIDKLSDRLDKA